MKEITRCESCIKILEIADTHYKLIEIICRLPERYYKILYHRFMVTEKISSIDEVNKIFSVTRERIRQIEVKAFNCIKQRMKLKYDIILYDQDIKDLIQKNREIIPYAKKKYYHNKEIFFKDKKLDKLLKFDISYLELSARTFNCLKASNINTINDLISKTENDLLKIKNFGRKALNEVKIILKIYSLKLDKSE